ncbi:hypothetical protein [Micromonospora purpureochromogenes]|uniref:Tryptophan-associated transmembrane protein (Trp_oprn_chp) n=1 Tax=Micromonospora purpureochromogenes TaxID=47872 RepID=A0ABX2RHI2_9ACTN|nr:hypothetical protein [Micromonospora purpureochromogenes]NYF55970.1 hypothetical protein [Micromonospora purpureochromogenes]
MSEDLPVPRQEDRSDGTAVVEWGSPSPAPAGRWGRALGGLGRDRRLPLVLAVLGAVAATASLVGEWLVMTLPNGGPEGDVTVRVPGGVAEVDGFGVAYLVGLLLLAAVTALALRGGPAVRREARLAGLAVAGALLALLTATAFSLDDSGQRALFYSSEDGFRVDYGRGLVMAFVATALAGAALQLAGRQPAEQAEGDTDPEAEPVDYRRPGRPENDGPADLTVTPTVPFARRESAG